MVVSQKKVVNFSWPRKMAPPWQFPGYATDWDVTFCNPGVTPVVDI
jgi:hypothetical protein